MASAPDDMLVHTSWGQDFASHPSWDEWFGRYQPERRVDAAKGHKVGSSQLALEFARRGLACVGGENSPYIWVEVKRDSWEFFDTLLNQAGVVCTPGAGFGRCGQGYVRFSAFNSRANVEEALGRIATLL